MEMKANVVEVKRDLDLGRSHLRVFNADGEFVIDYSQYKEIAADEAVRVDIGDPYNDFVITAAPRESIVGHRYVKGRAMSFYKSTVDQADNQALKVDQDATYINFAYIIAREIIDGYDTFNPTVFHVETGICIPTAEHYSSNGDELKKNIAGRYMITFPVNNKIIAFTVKEDGITITPEGPIAMMPTILEGDQSELIESTIGVIIDCGYGSNDITLVIDGEAQGDTARSFSYGGISLRSAVASALERNRYGSSETNVTLAIEKGYVMSGNEQKPVGKYVAECKLRLAHKIKQSVTAVVSENWKEMKDISYFFPVGRNFKVTTKDKNDPTFTGDLAQMLIDIWDAGIDKIEIYNGTEEFKCLNRTLAMKDGKYQKTDVDIYDVANVYGLGYVLSATSDEEDDEVEGTQED